MTHFDPRLLSRVEDAGLNASAPPQQRWLDGWLVRYSAGKAKRARCVNALAPGRLPLAERLALAAGVLREAGLPLIVRITPFSQPTGLDDELAGCGLHRFDDTRVMVADLAAMPTPPSLPDGLRLEAADANTFAAAVGTLRGTPLPQQRAHAERLQQSPVPYRGFVLHETSQAGGRPLACAQYAREADLVGLYDVHTAEPARNRRLATRLCEQLLRLAQHDGARTAYLQVDADNAAARAVYSRMGFADGYAYHYRAADPGNA